MNQQYLEQITNKNLKQLLAKEENIPALESIIEKESYKLRKLQWLKEKGELDLGRRMEFDEIEDIYKSIIKDVDTFLGFSPKNIPKIEHYNLFELNLTNPNIWLTYGLGAGMITNSILSIIGNQSPKSLQEAVLYFSLGGMNITMAIFLHLDKRDSSYSSGSEKITIEKKPRTILIPTIAHEYAHHCQNHALERIKRKYCIFVEGHARGIERYVSELYRKKEDNEAFMYSNTDRNVGELKSSYKWICRKLGKPIRKSILNARSSRDQDESVSNLIYRKPSDHAIGNALFLIYKTKYGNNIYKDMIHGIFPFE